MTLHSVLINANAIICLMLALRLMFFKNRPLSFFHLTNCLPRDSVCCVDSPTNFYGKYTQVDPAEFFLNLTICIAVWRARGNISKITGDR